MNTRKILSLAMALVMLLSASAAFADMTGDEYAAAANVKTELAESYEGKTVILHTNDVHGAVGGYAYVAALEKEFAARGAEVILAEAAAFFCSNCRTSFPRTAAAFFSYWRTISFHSASERSFSSMISS